MMIAQNLYLREANENLKWQLGNEDINSTKHMIGIDDN